MVRLMFFSSSYATEVHPGWRVDVGGTNFSSGALQLIFLCHSVCRSSSLPPTYRCSWLVSFYLATA